MFILGATLETAHSCRHFGNNARVRERTVRTFGLLSTLDADAARLARVTRRLRARWWCPTPRTNGGGCVFGRWNARARTRGVVVVDDVVEKTKKQERDFEWWE